MKDIQGLKLNFQGGQGGLEMAKIMARYYVTKKTPLLTCGNHALLVLDQP